ncbi:MAG: hypothetical protein QM696_02615 [Steroidobacteraceae bacterium]
MHPNAYLRTYWRGEIKPQIFVAMSFDDTYARRFEDVIRPAIEGIYFNNQPLKAVRVDLSKTGDSILTDIVDGIAHSAMVLADVSTVGNDSKTGKRYRNGNVMYEVGVALACRQSAEVLLIRDDKDNFLFDVSTIPHVTLDFSDATIARTRLRDELLGRLREIDLVHDARAQVAIASLTGTERQILAAFSRYPLGNQFWFTQEGLATMAAIPRLLDKQLIRTAGITNDNHAMFMWTPLGKALADRIDALVPVHDAAPIATEGADTQNPPETPANGS